MAKNALTTVASSPAAIAEKVYAEMPEVENDFTALKSKINRIFGSEIEKYYDLGADVVAINAKHQEKYGKRVMEAMSEVFGYSASLLSAAKVVAERYSKEDIERLLETRGSNDFRLYWTHITLLSRIVDADERKRFEELTLDNCLTSRQLEEELTKAQTISRRNRTPGETFLGPVSLTGYLSNIGSTVVRVLESANKLWFDDKKGFSAIVSATEPYQVPQLTLTKMLAQEKQLQEAAERLSVLSTDMARARMFFAQKAKEERLDEEAA